MSSENPIERIVIMANDIDRLGGVGRFMNRIAIEFHNRGYPVELVGVAPAPEGHRQTVDRPAGITTRTLMPSQIPANWTLRSRGNRMNPARRMRHRRRMELRSQAVEKLKTLLPEWGSKTLIICTQVYGMEHMIEAGYLAGHATMPRVIAMYHGSARESIADGDIRRILKSYRDADRFIALSSADAQRFQSEGLNNVGWIPNPVATPNHAAAERRKVFLSLGRYDEIKSLDYFLKAWNQIAEALPDWSIELYGEGPDRAHLEQVIRDLQIPRARLMGKTDDVGDVLASSSVHVLSSQNEGLPISIVEAGLLGVPSVAFDCAPGVHELISSGSDGYIVDQNDIRGLAAAMKALANDPDLLSAMSRAVSESSQRFSPEPIMKQWDREIAELAL